MNADDPQARRTCQEDEMPIPKKPNELREMIVQAIYDRTEELLPVGKPVDKIEWGEALSGAVMDAIVKYDKAFGLAAALGEPTFTLRAQDSTADDMVDGWACNLVWGTKDQSYTGPDKVADAKRIADAMRAWPNRRLPD